ncbi:MULTISPECIES: ATP-dependent helicase [Acinetobacter]|uniref:ATP-dependent helicase n=1 Tax=Acinetobacter TaxID=469 RepID=UPI00029E7D3F|nr:MULTISPECIES: ATP-dependent helicase [Acinetobacter]EKU60977.1 UvrD/REP helicase N-terminal domain protein [Acinetobacter nosocomialis]EXI11128.1 uvrD/REP helicase N-terminal domain protein [Acinetobacter sp. 694762]MBU3140516.1 ATP-dependent helicase [Acinetobacter nosocomialis]MCU4574443.1 ATP-dependent helicase [Acinetobacter nosocomialis]MCU4586733.1 ATP-dependent helicase [Acinetobacter nosocomialis]
MNLSQIQLQIVESPLDVPIQVLASAGAGKTRVLTERIKYILANTKKNGVIALTFTNKAADEMLMRLSFEENIQERTWITTIHSMGQRILEKYGHTVGLPTDLHVYERDQDKMEIFMQSLREDGIDVDEYLNVVDSRELKNREKQLQKYLDVFAQIKRELLTEFDILEEYPNKNVWKIYEAYQDSMIRSGGIDYDDILIYAHRILITHDWIAKIYRAKYKHICVDEAQDLNKIQYEFIKAFCGDTLKSVFMVGDPNQMIYGFNGSSNRYLCDEFVRDFLPKKYDLKDNYRSTREVIQVVNKLKSDSQVVSEYALKGQVHFNEYEDEIEEAKGILAQIQNLLQMRIHDEIEGEITLDKMVVIARNRFVFSSLEEVLRDNNIVYSLKKGERLLEPSTKFAKILDFSIRIKLNPKDWVNGKKLCQLLQLEEPLNWNNDVLLELADKINISSDPNRQLLSELLIAVYSLEVDNPKIPKLIKYFRDKFTIWIGRQSNISDTKYEDIRLSIQELDEFNHTWTIFKRKGIGDSLTAFRNALVLGQLSENNSEKGLTLSTVHTMKGLEKDIVFLMGMCEGVFPDYRALSKEQFEDERNSAFVAVTRAKRWLYVSYPKYRKMPWGDFKKQKKSRFMLEMEKDY